MHSIPLPASGIPGTVALPAPVSERDRNTAIDTLRGFALLGILLMNIVGFGMYVSAYNDPTVTGGATGINLAVWVVLHVLAEGKMRCLFSLVFGAGVILLTARLDDRTDGADVYYRRMLWLLAFGVAHAYLLWHGEILYPYALCGLVLYPFRKMSARGLLVISGLLIALSAGAYVYQGFHHRTMIADGRAALERASAGHTLTEEETGARREYEDWLRFAKPTPEQLEKNTAQWRGGPLDVIAARAEIVMKWHSASYYHPWNWDLWSMMFLGMALMKLRVLGAERALGFYAWLAAIGYGLGIPINSLSAWRIVSSGFDPAVQAFSSSTYDIGRLLIAMGHLGLLMVLCKTGALRWVTSRFAAIGQMAFSNYVLHSVVCAFVFTGYGFALYGQLERYQLYYVVFGLWIVQMIVSPIWLRHYRFGPLEWAWRSLTYWKRQPMRRLAPSPEVAGV
jgi:uncharacterized protein